MNDQTTSKLNHEDRTAEVVVDSQRPVNRDGHIWAKHKLYDRPAGVTVGS